VLLHSGSLPNFGSYEDMAAEGHTVWYGENVMSRRLP